MKVFLSTLFLTFCSLSYSQKEIFWDFSYNKSEGQIEMNATLAEGWHLYSTQLDNDNGPIETSFEFIDNNLVELVGSLHEPAPKVEFDPNFDQEVKYFEKNVVFSQKVKFKKKTTLNGSVVFMVCNSYTCLPPVEEKFEINLKK